MGRDFASNGARRMDEMSPGVVCASVARRTAGVLASPCGGGVHSSHVASPVLSAASSRGLARLDQFVEDVGADARPVSCEAAELLVRRERVRH